MQIPWALNNKGFVCKLRSVICEKFFVCLSCSHSIFHSTKLFTSDALQTIKSFLEKPGECIDHVISGEKKRKISSWATLINTEIKCWRPIKASALSGSNFTTKGQRKYNCFLGEALVLIRRFSGSLEIRR